MKNKKNLLLLLSIFAVIKLCFSSVSFATSSSADYILDYATISTGANQLNSNDYHVKAGLTAIESNLQSTDFIVTTINHFDDPICGNGILESGEDCDLGNLNGKTCADFSFNSGVLSCTATCTFNTSQCFNTSGGGGGGAHLPIIDDDDDDEDGDNFVDDDDLSEISIDPADAPNVIIDEHYDEIEESVTITPPPSSPPVLDETEELNLHASAEDAYYKKHLDNYKVGEIILTEDTTPIIYEELDENEIYIISILDKENKILSEKEVLADADGQLQAEMEDEFDLGNYKVNIIDKDSNIAQSFNIEIIEEKEDFILEVDEIASIKNPPNNYKDTVYLDLIVLNEDAKITGKSNPDNKVYLYIHDENQQLEVLETLSDSAGNYSFDISSLNLIGAYEIEIVQTYKDHIASKNLSYRLQFIDELSLNSDIRRQMLEDLAAARDRNQAIDLMCSSQSACTKTLNNYLSLVLTILLFIGMLFYRKD